MVQYIYYTGIGAKKSGKHTIKEFLDIMEKNYGIQCSEFLPDLYYKPCKEYKEMSKNALAYYNTKKNKLSFNVNKNNKTYKSLSKQCMKYKKHTKKRKCDLEEYIKFSGAEKYVSPIKDKEEIPLVPSLSKQELKAIELEIKKNNTNKQTKNKKIDFFQIWY